MISVRPTETEEERQICFGIRREVFVVGQDVPEDEEMDEFDDVVQHYIAFRGDEPVGTGRLRPVDENFIKFERVRVKRSMIDADSPSKDIGSAAVRLSSRCIWHDLMYCAQVSPRMTLKALLFHDPLLLVLCKCSAYQTGVCQMSPQAW